MSYREPSLSLSGFLFSRFGPDVSSSCLDSLKCGIVPTKRRAVPSVSL
jgi:hypothetical protein